MRTAHVRITEMNAGETRSFALEFDDTDDLARGIDHAIANGTWRNVSSQNFEIIVADEGQFQDQEMDTLEGEGIIFGY